MSGSKMKAWIPMMVFWVAIICVLLTAQVHANTCPFHPNISNSTGKSSDVCAANVDYQGTLSNQYHSSYPVNLLSGNKHLTETDIYPQNINGQIGLEFTRYYNSMSSHKGILGYGWRTIYEPQLLDRGNTLSLIQPDGTQFHFHLATDTKDGYKTDRYISNNPEYGYFVKISKGGLVEWQWYRPSGQRFTFIIDSRYMTAKETLGKLSKIVANHHEPNSDYIQVIYDKNHRIAQVVDSLGQKLIFNYQDKQVTLRFNNATYIYHQDDKYNLISYKNSEGDMFNYRYDNKTFPHSITQKTLTSDGQTQIMGSWHYDDKGRVDYEELPHQKKSLTIKYDPKAPNSKQDILYENGTRHYTTTTINGLGEVTKYIFTITGGFYKLIDKQYENCQSCDDLSMQKTDEQGNLIEQTIGDTTYFYTYDNQSRLTLIEVQSKDTPKQWQQKRQYVGDGRLPSQFIRSSTAPNKEHTLSITYNHYGQPTYIKEVGYRNSSTGIQKIIRDYRYDYELINGKSKLVSFDGALAGEQDKIHYHYDNKGQITTIHYPNNLSQKIQYDELGRVAIFTDLDNLIYQYQYDKKGNIIKSDEAGKVRHIEYNAFGKPIKITENSGQTLIYHYDESGILIGLSDDKSTKIEFVRDVENNLVSARLTDTQSKNTITVNDKDDLIFLETFSEFVQSAPKNTAYYNFQNRFDIFSHWFTGYPTQNLRNKDGKITTAYFDDFGRMSEEHSPITGKTHYDWDMLDNLSQVINHQGQVTQFVRDNLGNITQIQDDDGKTRLKWESANLKNIAGKDYQLSFEYNDKHQMVAKSYVFAKQTFQISYQYNEKGQLSNVIYPSGMNLNYRYDDTGQLINVRQKGFLKDRVLITDLHQKIGDNQSIVQNFVFGNGVNQTYSYATSGLPIMAGSQMTAYSQSVPYHNKHKIEYYYANGSDDIVGNMSQQSQHSDLSEQEHTYLDQNTTIGDTYNELGQLISQTDYRYTYDSQGRLSQVYQDDKLVVSYDYLYTGERYKKITYTNNKPNQTTYYLYDNGILLAEVHQDNHQQWQYTEYLHLGVRPVIQFNNKTPYYLTTDHRGAVMVATDDKKNIVWQANLTDNGYANITKQDITINLRGSNQYYDKDSDLHYNIHRYFDPQRNQYLTPDPLGITVGDDLYAFAHNRPHEYVDLWGLAPEIYEDLYSKMPFLEKAIIGMIVHRDLANRVNATPLMGWGGDNSRVLGKLGTTFGNLRPDAYYVDNANLNLETIGKPFKGILWELKLISYQQDGLKRQQGINQVNKYISTAKDRNRGCWSGGKYADISTHLNALNKYITLGKNIYEITTHADKPIDAKKGIYSGLVFYKATKIGNLSYDERPQEAIEPKIAPADKRHLDRIVEGIKESMKGESLGDLVIQGALILLAIILAILLAKLILALGSASAALAAIILLFSSTNALAKDGIADENGNHKKVSILEVLGKATGVDFSKESLISYAKTKFNQATEWVKGWFK